MGAWGYQPMDSDAALDWLGNQVTDHVGLQIRNLIELTEKYEDGVEHYAEELRAAADVVIKLNFFNNEPHYGDLWNDLAQCLLKLRRSSYAQGWSEPDKLLESLDEQITILHRGYATTTLYENAASL